MTDVATPARRSARLPEDPITRWLLLVAALVVVMVAVGGFVRLSRAGLSVVEWDVVTGVVPPIGETAWDQAFAEYQLTPEYALVNEAMTLSEFKRIYYYEWGHRLLARLAGLAVVLPLVWFLWKKRLTLRQSLPYWGIAALFGLQGALGWIMVSSGLRDRPRVSEFRLTIHLLAAVLLLAIALWMALERMRPANDDPPGLARRSALPWVLVGVVVVQLALGGLVAGLRAGHVSTTWPLMSGDLLPDGVFAGGLEGLLEPLGAHWIHRWFAMVVLGVALALVWQLLLRGDAASRRIATWLGAVLTVQVSLGVWTVWSNVSKWVAIAHQVTGVIAFAIALVIAHRVGTRRRLVEV